MAMASQPALFKGKTTHQKLMAGAFIYFFLPFKENNQPSWPRLKELPTRKLWFSHKSLTGFGLDPLEKSETFEATAVKAARLIHEKLAFQWRKLAPSFAVAKWFWSGFVCEDLFACRLLGLICCLLLFVFEGQSLTVLLFGVLFVCCIINLIINS